MGRIINDIKCTLGMRFTTKEKDGVRWFYKHNLHREDGPAIEYINGDREWWLNGKLHREDGPAIEFANGDKKWFLEGKLQLSLQKL